MAKTYYQYRAFIKDQLNLNTSPKAFLVVRSFTIRRDLLTSAKSKFKIMDIPSNVNEGDIFVLYNPKGTIMYYGVISSIDEDSLQCSQIQSFYKGLWICQNYPTTSLEGEVAYLLGRYSDGYQKNSTYRDMMQYQEKAPIYIKTSGTTTGQLETYEAKKSMDFEKFIYSLYKSYNLVFDFYIPFGTWNIGASNGGSVTIRKPVNSVIKIGSNAECVQNVTPTTKVEQTNKIIVFSANATTYRTTFIATTTNGIVTEPSSVVGRYGVINTKVIYSDDDLEVIKKANISADMYNHEIKFNLLLDNNLYDFWSWELGQNIQVYDGQNYFDSVFTGYEISKEENQNPSQVKITCGKVRNKLTNLLSMGIANDR